MQSESMSNKNHKKLFKEQMSYNLQYFGTQEKNEYPTVDIISVNFNSKHFVNNFLIGLSRIDYPSDRLNIIIIDNCSLDDSFHYLQRRTRNIKNIRFIKSKKNLFFTGGNNKGLRISKSDYKLLLNIDTKIRPDCIKRLVAKMKLDDKIGLVEARQIPHEQPKFYDKKTFETSWCSGACLLVRDKALKQVGFFDEKFTHYVEDVDLSWRMWSLDWKCIYEPKAECYHYNFSPEDSTKPRYSFLEFKFSIRNGIYMRLIYGGLYDCSLYFIKLIQIVFLSRHHSLKEKLVTLKSLFVFWFSLPHLLKRRSVFKKSKNAKCKFIKFHRMGYAKLKNN